MVFIRFETKVVLTERSVDKAQLEALLARIDIWLLVFGAVVVIGVAGESYFGIRHWWNSRKLQAIQNTENLGQQAEIERLKSESASIRSGTANAIERAAHAEQEAADAKRRQAEAEIQLEKVRKKQEARGVPSDIILATKNAPHGKVLIEYQDGPPETRLFTLNLWQHLRMAGWDIPEPIGVPSIAARGAGLSDITILWPAEGVRNPEESLPAYKVLFNAFMAAGYSLSGARSEGAPRETLILLVGPHQ